MHPPYIALVLLGGFLTACTVPREVLLARDRQDCAGFGFQPSTRDYADCLLRLDVARQSSHGHGAAGGRHF